MLGVVCLDPRIIPNPLIVLDQLGRDIVGQVGRHMIEDSGLELPDQHENLEIRDRETVSSEVTASFCLESLL